MHKSNWTEHRISIEDSRIVIKEALELASCLLRTFLLNAVFVENTFPCVFNSLKLDKHLRHEKPKGEGTRTRLDYIKIHKWKIAFRPVCLQFFESVFALFRDKQNSGF